MKKPLALAAALLLSPAAVLAQSISDDDFRPAHVGAPWNSDSLQLAAADMGGSSKSSDASADSGEAYKSRWFTANKTHQYLGIATIALAGLTAIAPKPGHDDDKESGTHHELGQATAVMGGLTVASGLGFHYGDIHLSRGFKDPDNLHALLGTLASIGFFAAVAEAPDAHAGWGVGSALVMLSAIKVTW